MRAPVRIAAVSAAALDVAAHHLAVSSPSAGAVASFVGVVRDHDPGVTGEVTLLEYSAHPQAEAVLGTLAAEVAAAYEPHGVCVAVSHRIGDLAVGDIAIVVTASAAHRAPAFAACRELVERVKFELPVWKRQHTAAGQTNWVGIDACAAGETP